jgi:hypothetical protein
MEPRFTTALHLLSFLGPGSRSLPDAPIRCRTLLRGLCGLIFASKHRQPDDAQETDGGQPVQPAPKGCV